MCRWTTLFRRKKIKIHFHKRTLKWNSTLACSCIAMASGKVAIQFKLEIKFSTHTYIGTKPFNPSEKELLVKHWCIFMSLGQSKQVKNARNHATYLPDFCRNTIVTNCKKSTYMDSGYKNNQLCTFYCIHVHDLITRI